MIVMKFGGTSLQDAEALQRVASIVQAHAGRRPIVVVSAMGKTTDGLLEAARLAVEGERETAISRVQGLRDYQIREASAAVRPDDRDELRAYITMHYDELVELIRGLAVLGEITPRSIDAISSYGERVSSFVMSLVLRAQGLDAAHVDTRTVFVTDDEFTHATPLPGPTEQRLREKVAPLVGAGKIPVMGGFIASNQKGVTTTLGRGGSDFTAALTGAFLEAEEVQIWTDVDGVLTADPTIVDGARRLKVLSFAEASELAYFGARVLHPSTVAPAVDRNIPVRVLNSRHPDGDGTLILADAPSPKSIVKSIAYKENIIVLDIRSSRMLMAHGVLSRIFQIFERYRTSVDVVTTSEVSVSLTVDHPKHLDEIIADLETFAEVSRTDHQAILCVVGDNLRYTPGIASKIFGALEGVNIRMISQGASKRNITLVIDENDLEPAICALHQEFFAEADKAVFA